MPTQGHAGSTVRSVGIGGIKGTVLANIPNGKKMLFNLSSGTVQALVIVDANQNVTALDGGDNTAVPKAYIYTAPVTPTSVGAWTLRATMAITATAGWSKVVWSASIDGSDNIHFVYADNTTQGKLVYIKNTFAAGAYTPGTAETALAAPASGNRVTSVDIDVAGAATGSQVPIVVCMWAPTTSGAGTFKTVVRGITAGTWATLADRIGYAPTAGSYNGAEQVSITADQSAITANRTTYMTTFPSYSTLYGLTGDIYQLIDLTTSTPAINFASSLVSGQSHGDTTAFHRLRIYNLGGDTYVLGGTTGVTPNWKQWVLKLSYNRSTNVITNWNGAQGTILTSSETNDIQMSPNSGYYGSDGINFADMIYTAQGHVIFVANNGSVVMRTAQIINGAGSTCTVQQMHTTRSFWSDGHIEGDNGGLFRLSEAPAALWGGSPRNYSDNPGVLSLWLWDFAGNAGYKFVYEQLFAYNAPVNVKALSTSTDLPTLSADATTTGYYIPPMYCKMQWQLASDAGFTTNLRTITQADTALASPGVFTQTVDALNALFQGVWYIRARAITELGGAGVYSAAVAFTVSHPPAAANMSPNSGNVLIFGTGSILFDWDFTDPYSLDIQTAYEILITKISDGSTVTDTGKITSGVSSALVTFLSANKGVPCQWQVKLWDGDNVAGAYSSPQAFMVTDPPAPVINTPADGAVLTNSIPAITWTSNVGAAATQAYYRILVRQGTTVVIDTGYVSDAVSTSYTIPTGTLKNSQVYTITLVIRDSLNLEGSDINTVSTNFTLPSVPGTKSIFGDYYASNGFVWVTQDPTGYDSAFVSMNLYRRAAGDASWTLIHQWTDPSKLMWYKDYLVEAGVTYQYAVTQAVNRLGDQVETSPDSDDIISITVQSANYWLLDPDDQASGGLPLYQVKDESFTETYEMQNYLVIGRGNHVDYGDRIGYNGTLTCQLRDKVMTGLSAVNYLSNPAFAYRDLTQAAAALDWAITSAGTITANATIFQATPDPLPSFANEALNLWAQGLGTTTADYVQVEQLVPSTDLGTIATGDPFLLSCWWQKNVSVVTARAFDLIMIFETNAGAVLQTSTVDMTTATVQEVKNGWSRLQVAATAPATTQRIRVRIRLHGNATGSVGDRNAVITGVQLEKGATRNPYFDGDQIGAGWVGQLGVSPSQTSGYYTARQQRLDIQAIKALRKALYMRNPFGDVWQVAAGDIGVDRIPGVGQNEFNDITIPYQEVAF